MGYRVGVDIGGTFTDFAVFDEDTGGISTLKVLSTPQTPGAEVLQGLSQIEARYGIAPSSVSYFTHGTTVGVNTVIQRKGATLALITTSGFEDVLEVGRLKMPDPYDLFSRRPPPLAPRELVYGLNERTLANGAVEREVDADELARVVSTAKAGGADAIAVALLHSYANPANERRVRELIQAIDPKLTVTLSSEVWPVIREYERTVTASVAGYVQGRVAYYLTTLQEALRKAGVAAEAMVTKSNGGVMRADLGKTQPIQMLLSGTASGVIGASRIAALAGTHEVLSFDVGGTSADVAIIIDGQPQFGLGELVGEFPIYVPTVSVTSIGAGGGSIARVDDLGVLKVGPESAGSNPGPACYGRGGTQPTITDAYAVCGFLGSGELGYGAVNLNLDLARKAVGSIAERMKMDLEQAAEAIIKVSISGMFLEVSKLFSRHGADPRAYSLLPFGGAGPMTACLLARDLGMKRIIVPPVPGVLAAYGGLVADIRNDFIRTTFVEVDKDGVAALGEYARELEEQGRAWLRDDQRFTGEPKLSWSGDMRYRGQSYEIEVPIEREWIDKGNLDAIRNAFHREHARVYEHADENAMVQVVNLRLVATGTAPRPEARRVEPVDGPATPVGETRVYFDNAWHAANVYDRAKLTAGQHFTGPAIVRQDDCTTCLVSGYDARVDPYLNIVVERKD